MQNGRKIIRSESTEFILATPFGFHKYKTRIGFIGGENNWNKLESELSVFYSKVGQSSVPIRTIAECLILK